MKEFLAAASVIGSFASVWYANYWLMSVDGSGKLRRHGVSIGIAVLISSALVWMLSPGEGADGIGWGWVLLACLLSLAMAAYAAAVPGAIEETLAKQSAPSIKPASPKAKTRAIRTGWSIGEVEFAYEDAEGEVTFRRVTVHSVTATHLKGECHERGEERTFRIDRIIGDLTDCETGEILKPKSWAKKVGRKG